MVRPIIDLASAANLRLKAVTLLTKKAQVRRERGLFTVEGSREILRALKAEFEIIELYFAEALLQDESRLVLAKALSAEASVFRLPIELFSKLVVRAEAGGLLAVFQQKLTLLETLQLSAEPLLLALQGVEKPGNVGALLRTADAVGVEAVVLLDDAVDQFNPNLIRSSLGTAFTVPVVRATSAAFAAFAAQRQIKVFAAALSDRAVDFADADYSKGAAILVGEEANGLTQDWLDRAHAVVKLPMLGVADSLNVSVAGAVLLYEALRQRR